MINKLNKLIKYKMKKLNKYIKKILNKLNKLKITTTLI